MLITSAVILGWLGVLLYLGLALSFQKLAKLNEYALIHLIMAILYALWLPLPVALYMLLPSEPLMTGIIFGLAYLFMLIITMALQAGYIAYIMKTPSQQGEYMMATLSNPFEKLANLFKSIWALFLAIAFWTAGELFMVVIMTLYSLLFFYYLSLLLSATIVRQIPRVKPNMYVTNLETLLFFIILLGYLSPL